MENHDTDSKMNNKKTDATQFLYVPKLMVSARTLHYFLSIKKPFHKWWNYCSDFRFDEVVDYIEVTDKSLAGRTITDYVLTLECAASICLLQRTDIAYITRDYFKAMDKTIRDPLGDYGITFIDYVPGNPFSHTAQAYFRDRLEVRKLSNL